MSESSAATVGMAIERFARNQFMIVSPKHAQVLIVDADRIVGTETLEDIDARHPDVPLVVLSSTDIQTDKGLVLRAPVSIQAVLDAVRSIRARATDATGATPKQPIEAATSSVEESARLTQVVTTEAEPVKLAETGHRANPPNPRITREEDCCGEAEDIPGRAPSHAIDHGLTHFNDPKNLS
jgi:hypothetical protein